MPGPVFSESQVEIHLDGSTLPAEAAAAGALAGEIFASSFNRELGALAVRVRKQMVAVGRESGVGFLSGLRPALRIVSRDFISTFRAISTRINQAGFWQWKMFDPLFTVLNGVETAFNRTRRGLVQFFSDVRDRGNDAWNVLREGATHLRVNLDDVATVFPRTVKGIRAVSSASQQLAKRVRPAFAQLGQDVRSIGDRFRVLGRAISTAVRPMIAAFRQMRQASKDSDGVSKGLGRQGSAWRKLSANTRQWILIIGAVAASMGQLAPLASAAAAGLVILGGAVAALAVGAIVGFAAFSGLSDEIGSLPAQVQPAAAAFQALGEQLKGLQQSIQIAAAPGLEVFFTSLQTVVTALTPSLERFGAIFGEVMAQLGTSLASPAGLDVLTTLVDGLATVFQSLMGAIFTFGAALGNVFVIALPYVQQFADWLGVIAQQFLDFTNTNPGVIDQWFANAAMILASFGDLLGAVGQALAQLVTPATVAMTVAFLDSLTGFIPALTGILAVLGELNIFGLLAGLLDALGPAIQVLVPPLMAVASVVSGVLVQAFASLAPVITSLASSFAPIIQLIADLAQTVLPPLLAIVTPILQAMVEFGSALLGALMPALQAIIPAVSGLLTALAPIGAFLASIISQLVPILVPVIQMLVPIIQQILGAITPIIQAILPPLMSLIQALVPLIALLVSEFVKLLEPILALISPLLELIQQIVPPLAELLSGVLTIAVQVLTAAFGMIIPMVTGVVKLFISTLAPAITMIADVLDGLINFIIGVFTGDWERAWDGIVGIFEGIWNGIVGIVEGAINGIIDLINGFINSVNNLGAAFGVRLDTVGHVAFASGGVVNGPTRALVGEAGPEMIIPMNRPLGAIDPSVRGAAAVLRGEAGASRVITVEEGAFQFVVTDERTGRLVANSVLDDLVADTAL